MTLQQINRMGQPRFIETVGWVFEHSPWVAEGVWHDRPFPSVDVLHERMVAEVAAASGEQRLALLRAHPDLGTRGRISKSSTSEQTEAGYDQMPEAEYNELLKLNEEYKKKFGFPFIYAVRGTRRATILEALASRLNAAPDEELSEALAQVYRIARLRLEEAVQ